MKNCILYILLFLPLLALAQQDMSLEEINSSLPDSQKLSKEDYDQLKSSLAENRGKLVAAEKRVEKIAVPAIQSNKSVSPYAEGAYKLRRDASRSSVKLRVREVEGLQLSEDWQNGYSKPTVGKDGRVVYHYGESTHTIVCSVRNVCDIQLEPGERVTQAPAIGDSVQWIVTPGKTGSGDTETVHIVIKPKNPGLHTSMIVFTDRRAYHFELKSTLDRHMSYVSFVYQEEMAQAWSNIIATKQRDRINSTLEVGGESMLIDNLEFDYRIKGRAAWKPVRVFNDDLKTYIQFPKSIRSGDVPVFMSIKNGQQEIMNYRLRGSTLIVDGLVNEGVLITGVGRNQTKVTIKKK